MASVCSPCLAVTGKELRFETSEELNAHFAEVHPAPKPDLVAEEAEKTAEISKDTTSFNEANSRFEIVGDAIFSIQQRLVAQDNNRIALESQVKSFILNVNAELIALTERVAVLEAKINATS